MEGCPAADVFQRRGMVSENIRRVQSAVVVGLGAFGTPLQIILVSALGMGENGVGFIQAFKDLGVSAFVGVVSARTVPEGSGNLGGCRPSVDTQHVVHARHLKNITNTLPLSDPSNGFEPAPMSRPERSFQNELSRDRGQAREWDHK